MKTIVFALLSTLSLGACATEAARMIRGDALTVVVVRHAEKAQDDPRDPSLSEAGRARAAALASTLRDAPLVAAYATAYKRTQQTAQPAAAAHVLAVTVYDAARPATEFAGALRAAHAGGTVLVVGHSNTVPEIVAALCACAVAPMGDAEYGNVYEIRFDAAGAPTLRQRSD